MVTDYLQEQLSRATKFEIMMNTEGWKLIEAYYTNKMADLTNRIFTSDKPAAEFQPEVDEIRGIREMMVSISHDLDVLHGQRKQSEPESDETTGD